jgi:DNA-binding response OmpR family regulator
METLAEKAVLCLSDTATCSPIESRRYGKLKILVIDDESANAELLEAILMDTGYEHVKAITDSRLALDVCRTFEPDLILLDLMMPHVDGFTILEALRFEPDGASLPVIVLTADESKETKLRVLDAGANDFILKPFDLAEVLFRIENLLALRERNVQLRMQRDRLEVALQAMTLESREAQPTLDKHSDRIR